MGRADARVGVTGIPLIRKPDRTMATSSRRTGSTPITWLTAAEQRVLDSTVGSSLATATRIQLQAAIKSARALRDKWRDLFHRQSITSKKGPTRTNDPVNTRSLEKADLFGAAVKRLEARVEELAEGISATVRGKRSTMKPARTAAAKPASKAVRNAGHRATRSSIRESLSEAVAGINAAGRRPLGAAQPTSKPTSKQPKAGKPAASGKASRQAKAAGKPVARRAKAAQSATSKKARQAGKLRSLAAAGTGQAIHFDPKQQRSAKARATATQIKLDGLSTRRRGHTLAAGKRKQARRDGR